MNFNKKILVIGAGIAGPTLCFWLKKYGFNPTLIERSEQLRTGGHAIDIRGIAVDIVKKMGLYDDLFAIRTSILSTRYVDDKGQVLSEDDGEKSGFRQADEIEIIRGDIVNILVQAIPDVPCYYHKEIIGLLQKDPCVEVTFKDGHIEHYDLVIGTDGLHSSTRGMAFSNEEYQFLNLRSYISVFKIPNYLNLNRTKVEFGKDNKFISVNSDKDPDSALVSFVFRAKQVLRGIDKVSGQKECLKNIFYDLGWESNKILDFMTDCDDLYFDVMAQIKMDSWFKGRIALLGDAGYCASPLSGQGAILAIVGAYILAGELKSAAGDYSVAFNRYNTLMRPLVDACQDLAIWLGESFLTEGEITKEITEQRSSLIMEKIKFAANAISLPEYE